MSTIENLRAFLMQCPFLAIPGDQKTPKVFVDYLSEHPTAYEIQLIPGTPWLRQYVDGGGVKQVLFVFRSLEIYEGREVQQNMDNITFFERFSQWMEETKPAIPGWIKVEALTDGYFFDVAEGQDKATYQIQCRILYSV